MRLLTRVEIFQVIQKDSESSGWVSKKDTIKRGRKSTKVMLLNVTKRSGSSESTIILIKHQHSDIFRNDGFVWGEVLPAMKCLYFTCVTSGNFKTSPIVCRTILGEHKRDNLVV